MSVGRSEDNLGKSVFSFYQVGPGNQTQMLRLEGRLLYPLNQLAKHTLIYFNSSADDEAREMAYRITPLAEEA